MVDVARQTLKLNDSSVAPVTFEGMVIDDVALVFGSEMENGDDAGQGTDFWSEKDCSAVEGESDTDVEVDCTQEKRERERRTVQPILVTLVKQQHCIHHRQDLSCDSCPKISSKGRQKVPPVLSAALSHELGANKTARR